jgi:hypothetical protein
LPQISAIFRNFLQFVRNFRNFLQFPQFFCNFRNFPQFSAIFRNFLGSTVIRQQSPLLCCRVHPYHAYLGLAPCIGRCVPSVMSLPEEKGGGHFQALWTRPSTPMAIPLCLSGGVRVSPHAGPGGQQRAPPGCPAAAGDGAAPEEPGGGGQPDVVPAHHGQAPIRRLLPPAALPTTSCHCLQAKYLGSHRCLMMALAEDDAEYSGARGARDIPALGTEVSHYYLPRASLSSH